MCVCVCVCVCAICKKIRAAGIRVIETYGTYGMIETCAKIDIFGAPKAPLHCFQK